MFFSGATSLMSPEGFFFCCCFLKFFSICCHQSCITTNSSTTGFHIVYGKRSLLNFLNGACVRCSLWWQSYSFSRYSEPFPCSSIFQGHFILLGRWFCFQLYQGSHLWLQFHCLPLSTLYSISLFSELSSLFPLIDHFRRCCIFWFPKLSPCLHLPLHLLAS